MAGAQLDCKDQAGLGSVSNIKPVNIREDYFPSPCTSKEKFFDFCRAVCSALDGKFKEDLQELKANIATTSLNGARPDYLLNIILLSRALHSTVSCLRSVQLEDKDLQLFQACEILSARFSAFTNLMTAARDTKAKVYSEILAPAIADLEMITQGFVNTFRNDTTKSGIFDTFRSLRA